MQEPIVYVDRADGALLWRANADGSDRRLIEGLDSKRCKLRCYFEQPTLSPSGGEIIFSDSIDLYIANVNGTNQRNLTNAEHGETHNGCSGICTNVPLEMYSGPEFSPDGTRVVFARRDIGGYHPERDGVWVMSVNGGPMTKVFSGFVSSPTWSPDSPATPEGEGSPDWSPDGSTVMFSIGSYDAPTRFGAINANGSNYRVIVSYPTYAVEHPTYRTGIGGPPPPPSVTQLLMDYAPQLRYDAQETFRADSASTITDNVVLDSRGKVLRRNTLRDAAGSILASPHLKERVADLALPFLGFPTYGDGGASSESDYLDEEGTDTEKAVDAQRMHANSGYANRIYGRVVPYPGGETVLQYWLWYYYNSKAIAGVGVHEGDWEMVSVVLGSDYRPQRAAYAQHSDGERCDWANVQRTLGGRPIVYVAQDSHASYFSAGDHMWDAGAVFDNADGQGGPPVVPAVEGIDNPPSWVSWPGRWGSSDGGGLNSPSPHGPATGANASKYAYPLSWVEGVSGCTESQTQASSSGRRGLSAKRPRRIAARPPAPTIRVKRHGSQVRIRYRFERWPAGRNQRPALLITSVDPRGDRYPPLTVRTRITSKKGRIMQPLGAGRAPFRVLASAQSRSGAVSSTVRRRLR